MPSGIEFQAEFTLIYAFDPPPVQATAKKVRELIGNVFVRLIKRDVGKLGDTP